MEQLPQGQDMNRELLEQLERAVTLDATQMSQPDGLPLKSNKSDMSSPTCCDNRPLCQCSSDDVNQSDGIIHPSPPNFTVNYDAVHAPFMKFFDKVETTLEENMSWALQFNSPLNSRFQNHDQETNTEMINDHQNTDRAEEITDNSNVEVPDKTVPGLQQDEPRQSLGGTMAGGELEMNETQGTTLETPQKPSSYAYSGVREQSAGPISTAYPNGSAGAPHPFLQQFETLAAIAPTYAPIAEHLLNTVASLLHQEFGIPPPPLIPNPHYWMSGPPPMEAPVPSLQPHNSNTEIWCLDIPKDATTGDVLSVIRNCGRIYYCQLRNYTMPGSGVKGAKIAFCTLDGASAFLTATRSATGVYLWGSKLRATRSKYLCNPCQDPFKSRVVRIMGFAQFVNFNYLAQFFKSRFSFDVCRIDKTPIDRFGHTSMDWHFGGIFQEAEVAVWMIEREPNFQGVVSAFYLPDPCE